RRAPVATGTSCPTLARRVEPCAYAVNVAHAERSCPPTPLFHAHDAALRGANRNRALATTAGGLAFVSAVLHLLCLALADAAHQGSSARDDARRGDRETQPESRRRGD